MGSAEPRRALLLGLIEVIRPVEHLVDNVRAEVLAMCLTASTTGQVDDPSWLGWLERGFMGVEVILDQQHLHITSEEVLVSQHYLAEVYDIMTVQGTEGHLVFIGYCQVKEVLLAVVLDMMSELDAKNLEDDVRQRLSQPVPFSARSSTPKDNRSRPAVSEVKTFKPDSDPEHDLSASLSHVSGSNSSHRANSTLALASASLARAGKPSLGMGVRSSFLSRDLTEPPPLPTKPVLPRIPNAVVPPRAKPPVAGKPSTPTLTATALRLVSRSPESMQPASHLGAAILAAAFQPASSESSPMASTPPVYTRPVSCPKKTDRQHVISAASNFAVSARPLSTLTVFNPPLSTPPVLSRPLSTAEVSSRPVIPPRPVPSVSVSFKPISSQSLSSNTWYTPLVSTVKSKTPKVSTRDISTSTVSARPSSIVTMSTRNVYVPNMPMRPLSLTKTFTPLVSVPLVSVPAVSSRPVPTPTASSQPISTFKVYAPLVSIPKVTDIAVSGIAESTSMAATTAVSTSTIFTQPAVATTLVSTPVVTSLPVTLSPSTTVLSSQSLPGQDNQFSTLSSSRQEKELDINVKMGESEQLYITSLQLPLKQDSFISLEQELFRFLENEHQYLSTLQRINNAKKVLTSELQNLLMGSDRLADFHDDLYRNLYQEFPSSSGIAQVFLTCKEGLEQYRYYIMNAPQVTSQLAQQKEGMSQHPTLEADIKSSWKRLHFYFMTFERLMKIVPTEEQQLVQKVVDILRETNRQGDSGILIDAVKGAPFNLHALGPVVLHSLFNINDSSNMLSSRMKYHVLLFEEMLIILLPKKEKYQYRNHLPLRQVNLHSSSNSDEATFMLELLQGASKRKRKYTFRPRQQEAKDVWVAELSRLLLKYKEEVERLHKLRCGYQ